MRIIKEWVKGGNLTARFYTVEGRFFLDFHGCQDTCEVMINSGGAQYNYPAQEVPISYRKWINNWVLRGCK